MSYKNYVFIVISVLFGCNTCTGQKDNEINNISLENASTLIKSSVSKITYTNLKTYQPEISVKKVSDNIIKVNLTFELKEVVRQDDWQLNIYPSFKPTFNWAPHLTPTDEHIIDQHSFRSPAMIIQDSVRQLIVIPDLDIMQKGTPVRWYMDMNAIENKLTIGMSNYKVKEHILYVRDTGAVYPQGKVEIGFYLMAFDDKENIKNPWRTPLAFLWEKWGRSLYESGQPIKGSLDVYVKNTYDWVFDRWKGSTWQEFDIDGKKVGAPAYMVDISQSPNYRGEKKKRKYQTLWNQAWFSSLRSAQGLYRYGRRIKNAEYVRKANLTKELALSFPQKNGFFNSVIATEDNWNTHVWGNCDRNPYVKPYSGEEVLSPYHILDMSWTALEMLRWYEELEKDERLLQYAISYAKALLPLQDKEGFFPAWLDKDSLKPSGVLNQSPETSMSVTFLLKLYNLTGNKEYLTSALKAMDAVIINVIPERRWEDFETYWSCSRYGSKDLVGKKIARNNMYKQCNFSMFWTAEALYYCYKQTNNHHYLELGQRCLDELLMTQASWQPPYIYINTFGGFGVMNADAEWNDARQSLFAELIVLYGKELNNNEYIQRGLAAMRASFEMMYCLENPKAKEQWEKKYGFFNEKDYGFMMENYGHAGVAHSDGTGMGGVTHYDWGNGSASEGYNRMLDHFGEEFVNNK